MYTPLASSKIKLTYPQMAETFKKAFGFYWDSNTDYQRTGQNPYSLLTPTCFWALVCGLYFPIAKTQEYIQDFEVFHEQARAQMFVVDLNDVLVQNPVVLDQIEENLNKLKKHIRANILHENLDAFSSAKERICQLELEDLSERTVQKKAKKILRKMGEEKDSTDKMLAYASKKLNELTETNQAYLKGIEKKVKDAFRQPLCQEEELLEEMESPKLFYAYSLQKLLSMESNGADQAFNEKNLLMDIQFPSSVEKEYYNSFGGNILTEILKNTLRMSNEEEVRESEEMGEAVREEPAVRTVRKKENNYQAPEKKLKCFKEEDYCFVCGEEDYEDDDLIVYCDGCNIPVHQCCYGIERVVENEDWLCSNCQAFGSDMGSKVRCILCRQVGGAQRPSKLLMSEFRKVLGRHELGKSLHSTQFANDLFRGQEKNLTLEEILSQEADFSSRETESFSEGKKDSYIKKFLRSKNEQPTESKYAWVHMNCGLMLSKDMQLLHNAFLFEMSCIEFSKVNHPCSFCGYSLTPKLKCSNSLCNEFFHAECGRINGINLEFGELKGQGFAISSKKKVYCLTHMNQRKMKLLENYQKQKVNELLAFTKNFNTIYDNRNKRINHRIKQQMGPQSYSKLVHPKLDTQGLEAKVKNQYNQREDSVELVRHCLTQICEIFKFDIAQRAPLSFNDYIDQQAPKWSNICKTAGFVNLQIKFKNLSGDQTIKAFKKLVQNENKYMILLEMYCEEVESGKLKTEDFQKVIGLQEHEEKRVHIFGLDAPMMTLTKREMKAALKMLNKPVICF